MLHQAQDMVKGGQSLIPASFLHPSGPSREECIHCAKNFHFQEWKCVPACGEGFYPEEMPGLPHKVCRRYAVLSDGLPGSGQDSQNPGHRCQQRSSRGCQV